MEAEDWLYRNYVTECLKVVSGNTAKANGGAAIGKSYRELITKDDDTEPAQSGEEIINRLKSKLSKFGEQG